MGGKRLDDVAQRDVREVAPDGQRGLLKPLTRFGTQGVGPVTGEENLLRQTDARLRQTIAQQFEEIRDLRHQVTQLTLAAAVNTQNQARTHAPRPAPDNVAPLWSDKN